MFKLSIANLYVKYSKFVILVHVFSGYEC